MVGNAKFVAHLIVSKMLASEVIFQCAEELLHHDTEETIETLCAFLTIIGPAFDTAESPQRAALADIFAQLKSKKEAKEGSMRCRSLIMDLLDLREANWAGAKTPKGATPTGPMMLSEVHRQWEKDLAQEQGHVRLGRSEGRRRAAVLSARAFLGHDRRRKKEM